MANKYRTYKKDLDYSYTLGIFLTIELLKHKPEQVITVIIHSKGSSSEGINKIKKMCREKNISCETNDKLIEILSPKKNCFAIGIFAKYEEKLAKDENHLVLVNPSDSGNLGTIIRTGLGFGVNNLAIIKPGVDIFDPKTVRASMGALFNIAFTYFDSFSLYQNHFSNHDFYPFMLDAKIKIYDVKRNPANPFSLIFGNEASGLDESFKNIGNSVIIPHDNTIDSLNLSIAAGIALYEFTKAK